MVTFRVPDMTCGHCASTIARAVAAVDAGARVDVSVADKLVSIASPVAGAEFEQAIREAGYSPAKVVAASFSPARSGGCCCGTRAAAPVHNAPATASAGDSCCG